MLKKFSAQKRLDPFKSSFSVSSPISPSLSFAAASVGSATTPTSSTIEESIQSVSYTDTTASSHPNGATSPHFSQGTSNVEYLCDLVQKRIVTLPHEGRSHRFNTILISHADLGRESSNNAPEIQKRTTRFAIRAMSLSNLLDINSPQGFLRGIIQMMSEYDQNSRDDGDKPKTRQSRRLFGHKNSKRGDDTVSFPDCSYACDLMMPHPSSPFDYHQTLLSLLDVISEICNKICEIGSSPFAHLFRHIMNLLGVSSPHPGVSYIPSGYNVLTGNTNASQTSTPHVQYHSPPAARDSLQSNNEMLEVIQELRETGPSTYAMSNISAPDWEVLRTRATSAEWALFDYTFTSVAARERKPDIEFFKHIIERTGIGLSRTIFVDGKLENVLIARSFGIHGIVFDDQLKVTKDLKNLDYDPVLRGKRFLASRKKKLNSVTSNGIELLENFAQLLILEATGDQSLVTYVKHPGQFNFFQNGGVLTTKDFPNDLDTTSLGLTISDHIDAGTKHRVMDEMLEYQNSDGIIQVYFDHSRPRTDLVVCVNVFNLFYKNERGHELSETLNWVEQALVNRTYIPGTHYYVSADHFLFFFSRLLQNSEEVRRRLGAVFKERIRERFGVEGDSLSLAARIIAATVMDLVDDFDLRTLLSMQRGDGSWGDSWFYQYGLSGIRIKNDGVTTALAVQAIEKVQLLRNMQSNA